MFTTIDEHHLAQEHICCAISDGKQLHCDGVTMKKAWLQERMKEGHVFRKLAQRGKVFIEYAPLESAWVPVQGENYLFIYCLWVSGSFSKKGYGDALLRSCIEDAKKQNKSGICVLSATKKKPFLSDKKFFAHYGFEKVDAIGEYEVLALSFDGTIPYLSDHAKTTTIDAKGLVIYYSHQCPFTSQCIDQIKAYCEEQGQPFVSIPITSREQALKVPSVFLNWALFYEGNFVTAQIQNVNSLKKLLEQVKMAVN